jgi:uncharacterized protein YutE (UPF0331/DUF86 family)
MGEDNIITCEFCKMTCKTKYSLSSHMSRSKKCLKIRGLSLDNTYSCRGCKAVFATRINLNVHTESCKDHAVIITKEESDKKIGEYTTEIDRLKMELKTTKQAHFREAMTLAEQNEKQLSDLKQKHERELSDIKLFHEKEKAFLEQHLNRVQTSYESIATSIAKEAINKPTNSTTHNTVNNIRNVLSSKYTVDELDHDQLMLVFKKALTEDVLLGGQPAIAKICSENIIQTDDSKMRMCCTDTSRDKFKYMDASGNVKEDFQARHFTSKIIKPLEAVGQEVYDTACTNISEEQNALESEQTPQYGRMSFLKNKEERLAVSLMELRSIDQPNHNSKFVNELAVLTKS